MLLLPWVVTACAPAVAFDSLTSVPFRVRGFLSKPEGPGPFPAVVLLHGCSGVIATETGWARELTKLGYVTLIVDSFGPRGFDEICTDFRRVIRLERVLDAYGALRWLRTQPFVKPEAIGVMRFSHGGYTLLEAMKSPLTLVPEGFRAAVGMYPQCRYDIGMDVYAPTMILIGEADDWTLARFCRDLVDSPARSGAPVLLHVYPGAHHSFDNPSAGHRYLRDVRNSNRPGGCCGATIAHDWRAHADAIERVGAFFAEHLGGQVPAAR